MSSASIFSTQSKLVLLGVGNSALALARHYQEIAAGGKIYGTTRSEAKISALENAGIEALHDDQSPNFIEQLKDACSEAFVLVSFPPAGQENDQAELRYLPAAAAPALKKIVYISSTAVYGQTSGVIDETTPTSAGAEAAARLAAENYMRGLGACVLRAPGLYGPFTGLHKRLLAGTYNLPGDGGNYVSRIHLDDLARIICAAFERAAAGSTYLVGDLQPSTHIETVTWLCGKLNLPLPPSLPLDDPSIHSTMRASRRVDSSLLRRQLQIDLNYPTYKEGFSQCLASLRG